MVRGTGKMLKIWSMKQDKEKSEAASGKSKMKKVTAAQLRVQKGESEPIYIRESRLRHE